MLAQIEAKLIINIDLLHVTVQGVQAKLISSDYTLGHCLDEKVQKFCYVKSFSKKSHKFEQISDM